MQELGMDIKLFVCLFLITSQNLKIKYQIELWSVATYESRLERNFYPLAIGNNRFIGMGEGE